MTRTVTAAAALLAATIFSTGSAFAQAAPVSSPAETPPASFEGRDYVDSRGCVFVRADGTGTTVWVPRMTRDREHICNQTPTVLASAPAPAPAPVRIAQPAAPVTVAAPAQAEMPRALAAAAPQISYNPPPRRVVERSYVYPVAPVRAAAAPETIWKAGDTMLLQPGRVVGEVRSGTPPRGTRIVPRHVYEQRANTRVPSPPPGYEPVWDDDRLNYRRAEQTLEGRNKMLLVWTNTVPRRLINPYTGQDVTAKYPTIIYPNTGKSH